MRIYDSVHGFIHFGSLETQLIDCDAFQRLHYLRQLGMAYLIYPGGTHTRFEHSLGTMYLASLIFDHLAPGEERPFWRQMVRFAALCHDLGHLPFSHVAEKRLLQEGGHEKWTLQIIESPEMAHVWENAEIEFPGKQIAETVGKLALGEEKYLSIRPSAQFSKWEKVYSSIITGDFFGTDRIDYLLRDAKATGLTYGLFDYAQLIEMLLLLPTENGEMVIGVDENGVESCEALLLARHFMQRRVYQHPTIKAFSFHLARFMELLYGDPANFASVEAYLAMSEAEVLCALQAARKDPSDPGHHDALAIFDRKKRYTATHLAPEVSLSSLENFQKGEGIPPGAIHWDLAQQNSLSSKFSLPVLLRTGEITPASQFSEISIPPTKKNWLYLAPEYQFEL